MHLKTLTEQESQEILKILEQRISKNRFGLQNINWAELQLKLTQNPEKLWSIYQMEKTGGEPDLVGFIEKNSTFVFYDCSPESPSERRSLCYDAEALEARKTHKPKNSAIKIAQEMGVELLNEEEYRQLQEWGNFDTKTSSWLLTPEEIRQLGGALFGDKRFNTTFIYHNGAESYYAARGFRGKLIV